MIKEVATYFHRQCIQFGIQAPPGRYPDFQSKKDVDAWVEHRRLQIEFVTYCEGDLLDGKQGG